MWSKERDLIFKLRAGETKLTLDVDDGGNSTTRALGLVVARGTVLTSISPVAGSKEIDNPFGQEEG